MSETDFTSSLVKEQFVKNAYGPSSSMISNEEETLNLIKVLTDHTITLEKLRHQFRGEDLSIDEMSNNASWIQVDKPMFIQLDKNNKPIMRYNPRTGRDEYKCNEDAINAIMQILKASGLNQITSMTVLDENIIRDDLREIQSKVAVLLANKRKVWGIDKAEYPYIVSAINTMIQDARYRAKEGIGLKAVRTITSRIEQSNEAMKARSIQERIKSPFS